MPIIRSDDESDPTTNAPANVPSDTNDVSVVTLVQSMDTLTPPTTSVGLLEFPPLETPTRETTFSLSPTPETSDTQPTVVGSSTPSKAAIIATFYSPAHSPISLLLWLKEKDGCKIEYECLNKHPNTDFNNTSQTLCVQILTERLCLSALLELCRVGIYTQPADAKIHHKLC